MKGIWRVAAMLALSGAIAGFTTSLFFPHRYLSTARFTFVKPYDAKAQSYFDGASEVTLMPQSLEMMVRQSPNFKNQLFLDPAPEIVAQIRATLTLKLSGTTGTIEYEDDDVDTALEVTTVVLSDFGNNAARLVSAKSANEVIRILQRPSAHLTGFTPWLLTGAGLVAGLFVFLLIWLFLPGRSTVAG